MKEQNNLDNFILQGKITLEKTKKDYSYHGNELLPLGSVVRIINDDNQYMIIGHNYKKENIIYSYISCSYPNGIKENCKCFQKEDIIKIDYIGMAIKDENNHNN